MVTPHKKILIEKADRLYQMPLDLFSFAQRGEKPSLIKRSELIDLGRFNWPLQFEEAPNITGSDLGRAGSKKMAELKEELSLWLNGQHGVRFDPEKEVFIGGSISDLILALSLAFIDNGDIAFIPGLGIPLYRRVINASGGEAVGYSISSKNDWLPDFRRIKSRLGRAAKMLILNSPHNPTGVELTEKEFDELIWLASRENIFLVNDAAYYSTPNRKPTSLLSVASAKKTSVELYSFSYLLGLPSMPFGFIAGNREIISGLKTASQLTPTRISNYAVDLIIAALRDYPGEGIKAARKGFSKSLLAAGELFDLLSLEKVGSDTIPYIWTRIDHRRQSATFASALYRGSRILCAPGSAFGNNGEGFLRFSLTASSETYKTAVSRLAKKPRLAKLMKNR